MMTYF